MAAHPVQDILSNLPHRVDVYRQTRHQDSLGGDVLVWTRILTSVACWAQTKRQERDDNFDKQEFSVKARVYFRVNPGIDERDILYQAATGESWEVQSAADVGVRYDGPFSADCQRWSGDVDSLIVS